MDSKRLVEKISTLLRFIRDEGLLERGYVCGFVNGLIWAKAKLENEEPIFERDEVQPVCNKRLEFCSVRAMNEMEKELMRLVCERKKGANGKHRNTKHKKTD